MTLIDTDNCVLVEAIWDNQFRGKTFLLCEPDKITKHLKDKPACLKETLCLLYEFQTLEEKVEKIQINPTDKQ